MDFSFKGSAVHDVRVQLQLSWAALSKQTGLSERTLRSINAGKTHKVETLFQFELIYNYLAFGECWESVKYDLDLYKDCMEHDVGFNSITESFTGSLRPCVAAMALPTSGIARLISIWKSDKAIGRIFDPEESKEVKQGLDASYLSWKSLSAAVWRRNEKLQADLLSLSLGELEQTRTPSLQKEILFTIHEDLRPISKVLKNKLQNLEHILKKFELQFDIDLNMSTSLTEELKNSENTDPTPELVSAINALKRLKVNVLVAVSKRVIELESSEFEEEDVPNRPLLPSYFVKTMNIILAPARILKLLLPYPAVSVKYLEEPDYMFMYQQWPEGTVIPLKGDLTDAKDLKAKKNPDEVKVPAHIINFKPRDDKKKP